MRRQSKSAGTSPDARPIHLLNQEEIQSLFSDIAAGLAFLHERNMLHLDIKAENILLHRADGDDSYVYVPLKQFVFRLDLLLKICLPQPHSNVERFWICRSTKCYNS